MAAGTLPLTLIKREDSHGWIGTETVKTRFGSFEFRNGYPTPEGTDKLWRSAHAQCAT
jgi:hypothetical protein